MVLKMATHCFYHRNAAFLKREAVVTAFWSLSLNSPFSPTARGLGAGAWVPLTVLSGVGRAKLQDSGAGEEI